MLARFTTSLFTATLGDDQQWHVEVLDDSFGSGYGNGVAIDLNSRFKPGSESTFMTWREYARQTAIEFKALTLEFAGSQTFDLRSIIPVEYPQSDAAPIESESAPRRKPKRESVSSGS